MLCLSTAAQQVKVSGKLKTSDSQYATPQAILNDTLQRFSKKYLGKPEPDEEEKFWKHYNEFKALFTDSTIVARPDVQDRFSLTADLRDSIIFSASQHYTERHAVSDLLKNGAINIVLEKIPCLPFQQCNTPSQKLYVFIGEKISVDHAEGKIYCNTISFDSEYDAKYKIIKNIYGDYKGDSIKFTAYDHYGTPSFSHHKYVLLFVAEYCGKLIHEKYQFFDVYPTENGRWASPGNPWRFDRPDTTVVQGESIPFGDLNFDKYLDVKYKNLKFPSPYFKINGNCVEPVMGAYVEDLFEIKKKTTLKARGFAFTPAN
jgi:hypothetical protein